MSSQFDKASNNLWNESERKKAMSSQNLNQIKSIKRLKSPKKIQDFKKTPNDMKIEDVFLNSEYFKYQSGNKSSLSFCSGDNAENRWTVDSKFEIPFRHKSLKLSTYANDTIKSDTAVLAEKGKESSKNWMTKIKKHHSPVKEDQENTDKFLEGILSEKGRIDRDLITLITEQMFLAERELQITRTHLVETISKLNERDLEIIQLHEKIQNLQKRPEISKSDNSDTDKNECLTKSTEDYQRLIMASEKLKKQVKDMEEFLNDYGLVWVGDKDVSHKPDFDKIMKNFEKLNIIATQPKIIQTTSGARFELPREIPIVFYANGFLLGDDFREYSKISTSLFLQDVEDGYYPSELQIDYPEGVPFEVIDKRSEIYNKNGKIKTFQGRGNRLGSSFEGKPASVVYLEPIKQSRGHDNSSLYSQEYLIKSPVKKLNKKRSRNLSLQEDPQNFIAKQINIISHQLSIEENREQDTQNLVSKQFRVKIRYGKEKTEVFVLPIQENKKMYEFQTSLQKKLCEMYHNDCIISDGKNFRTTDFELHVYGRNSFRLSDCLSMYPKECGIVNNCVINITEI